MVQEAASAAAATASSAATTTPTAAYEFDGSRLSPLMDPQKTPLILVACGSFSPLTFLHLRMFEMARDHAHFHTEFSVLGGYLSPVNDLYSKPGLASAYDRINMCKLAVEDGTSEWLSVDDWEATHQPEYTPTALVLDHFDYEINERRGGVDCYMGVDEKTGLDLWEKRRARIMLLAGSDLILTMSEPGVWAEKDLHHILGLYGCYIIERAESELDQSIFSSSAVHSRSPLALYRHNIFMVDQLVRNDVSSTKVRMFLRKGMSVRYLIPGVVVKYIEREGLYRGDSASERRTRHGPTVSSTSTPLLQSPTGSSVDLSLLRLDNGKAKTKTKKVVTVTTSSSRPSPRSVASSPPALASFRSGSVSPSTIGDPHALSGAGVAVDRKGKGKANTEDVNSGSLASTSTTTSTSTSTSPPPFKLSSSSSTPTFPSSGHTISTSVPVRSALSTLLLSSPTPSAARRRNVLLLQEDDRESQSTTPNEVFENEAGGGQHLNHREVGGDEEEEEDGEEEEKEEEYSSRTQPISLPLPSPSPRSLPREMARSPMSPSALLNASRKERLPTGGRSESESRLNTWLH